VTIVGVASVCLLPPVRDRLVAGASGRPTFRGRTAASWASRIRDFPRPARPAEAWSRKWLGDTAADVVWGEHRPPPFDADAVPVLIELFGEDDPDVRSYAADVLGRLGDAALPAVPALQRLAADAGRTQKASVASVAAEAMDRLGVGQPAGP
jgi:hypothetical protein